MLGGRLLHGGDYNPDQWLAYPEVFEEDVRLMKEAGVTVTERSSAAGEEEKQIVFVMNFKNESVTVEGIGRWTDAESGEACEGSLRLEAFQCRVLTR